MRSRVELTFVTLRRLDVVQRDAPPGAHTIGLETEILDFIERNSVRRLADALLDGVGDDLSPRDAASRVCALVDDGRIEVAMQSLGGGSHPRAPVSGPKSAELAKLVAPTSPPTEAEVFSPDTKTSDAQVVALLTAAESGAPFCEVCERKAEERAARQAEKDAATEVDEAAQVDALVDASESGTPYCEAHL